MAYRNFKESELTKKFGITQRSVRLFNGDKIQPIAPSQRLIDKLEDAHLMNITTEKAVSEAIITPIMMEMKRLNLDKIQIYSGEIINADTSQGLNGEIDFIITKFPYHTEPTAPIIAVTEAKASRVLKAVPQAMAQMLGARVFNQKGGENVDIIHGIITDGDVWIFLRLEDNIVSVDEEKYYINDLPHLLGGLQRIVDFYV